MNLVSARRRNGWGERVGRGWQDRPKREGDVAPETHSGGDESGRIEAETDFLLGEACLEFLMSRRRSAIPVIFLPLAYESCAAAALIG